MSKPVLIVVFIFILSSLGFSQSKTAPPKVKKDIRGVWGLVEKPTDSVNGGSRLKFIMDGRWSLTQSDSVSHVTLYHHGGSYTLTDSSYSENIDYANSSTASYIGTNANFSLRLEGDILYLTGIGNPWNEIWKRLH